MSVESASKRGRVSRLVTGKAVPSFGWVELAGPYDFHIERRAAFALPAPHVHVNLELIHVRRGVFEHWQEGRLHRWRAGSVAVYWGLMPHRCARVSSGNECLIVHVPLALLAEAGRHVAWLRRPGLAGVCLRRGAEVDGVARAILDDWAARSPGGATTAGDRLALLLLLERLATGERGTGDKGDPLEARAGDESASASLRLFSYLSEHYREPLRAPEIGRVLGLSMDTAARRFRRDLGLSMWEALLRLRLAHVQDQLMNTDKAVGEVAFEAGFGSLRHFYAAFRARFGSNPGDWRERHSSRSAASPQARR